MISYDRRAYYDSSREKVIDPEWDEASEADEPEIYYWIIRDLRHQERKMIKRYKPSVCKLVCKRTGWRAIPVSEGGTK